MSCLIAAYCAYAIIYSFRGRDVHSMPSYYNIVLSLCYSEEEQVEGEASELA